MRWCKRGYVRTTEGLVNRFWCKLEENTHSDLLGEVLGWDVTSVWALMWTSATKNFSNLDLSHAKFKNWSTPSQSTFTPIALNLISFLARRNNWDKVFFLLYYESAKALDVKTRSCGHIHQDHAQLCAVTLTVKLQTCCHPLGQQSWFSLNQQSIKLSMHHRLW